MSSALALRGYDAAWLKSTFLLGVDLTLDDGTAYPDVVFEDALAQAERAIGDELGLTLAPQVIRERQDREPGLSAGWYPIRTRHRPLIEVQELAVLYGRSVSRAILPATWATIPEPMAGQIHIIPTTDGAASYVISGGQPIILGFGGMSGVDPYIPAYFEITYSAGFPLYTGAATIPAGALSVEAPIGRAFQDIYSASASTGATVSAKGFESLTLTRTGASTAAPLAVTWTVDTLPAPIVRAVGLQGASLALNIAGDLIAGAGIAQQSQGIDGLSQSIATTASATNAGYGARLGQFEKELKALMKTLKATYRAFNIAAL
ncbi:MAG: hypothetical protein FJ138_00370 [Deltaproteobacteria bacterium]|nr:hypothetical protein [Deltaproteobacteria bacterium]